MDKITAQRIQLLHPTIISEVTKIVNECNIMLTGKAKLRLTHTLRTNAEQNELYALGRTKKSHIGVTSKKPLGSIVTNAKGGQSVHNYGFAVDGVLLIDGKDISWDFKKDFDNDNISDWDEIVKIFAKYGWSWGGSWSKFKDFPHFEKIGRNNVKILASLKKDNNGYVII